MPASRVFFYLCLAFIGGVAVSSLVVTPKLFAFGFFIFGIIVISVFWKKNMWDLRNPTYRAKIVVAGFCLLIFVLGIWRYQASPLPKDNFEYYKAHYSAHVRSHALLTLKSELGASIDRSLSPPQSALLGALILGETERLSKDFKQKLNISGTRHITAISGMNVTILGNMLIGLGLILGLYRGQAFYFALAFIILFTIMVGAPPSAVRAAVMGGIVLFSEKIGRLAQADRLLLFAAASMLVLNPLLLKFDIGFQLSFLATLGIIKLYPYLKEKFSFVPKFFEIRNTVSMTIPAIIFTAPVLLSNFGQFSLVGLFTNILIIPVLAFILGVGFFGALLGILFDPLGQILLWPVWLLLTYVYKIITWSASIPLASVQIEGFPWYLMAGYFALLWWRMKRLKVAR